MSDNLLERGEIFFFYRPLVRDDDTEQIVRSLHDVERFYVVLHSVGRHVFRRIMLKKQRDALLGVVDEVSAAPEDLADALLRGAYSGAISRPAGEGTYAIKSEGDLLRLDYRLLIPESPGPLQFALEIDAMGSLVLNVTPALLDHEGTRLTMSTYPPLIEAAL